jgi:WD40 repeat protein
MRCRLLILIWLQTDFIQIWSIRFSGDGREIVAGTSDRSVYVYDIETRKSILRIAAHEYDVNAVCFGDTSSPHILYSGSMTLPSKSGIGGVWVTAEKRVFSWVIRKA